MTNRAKSGTRPVPARPDRLRTEGRSSGRRREYAERVQENAPMLVWHPVPGQRIGISGFVDAASVTEVRIELHEAVDHGIGELVVQLDGFVLGDATGLGALVGAHRRATRSGRSIVLTGVPDGLRRALLYTRLIRVLAVRDEPTSIYAAPSELGGDIVATA